MVLAEFVKNSLFLSWILAVQWLFVPGETAVVGVSLGEMDFTLIVLDSKLQGIDENMTRLLEYAKEAARNTQGRHMKEQKDFNVVEKELIDADEEEMRSQFLVHSLLAKGEMRTKFAVNIRSLADSMKDTLQELLRDMRKVITHTTRFTRKDDGLLKRWHGWHDSWFCSWLAGAKPQRKVPHQAAKMSQAVKEDLQDWGEQATSLARCMEDIDEMCDDDVMVASFDALQNDFDQVDKHWTNYTRQLCEYHGWDICKTETVLMELRDLDNPSRGTYLQLSFCIMAFIGVFVGAASSRRRVRKPGNEMSQALLS